MSSRLNHCPYCKISLTPKGFQIDHIVPLARGGDWSLLNVQPVCTPCNRRKHALLDGEYRQLLAFLAGCSALMRSNILARLSAGGAWIASR